MASCCTPTQDRTASGVLTIALAGNPNCGKTTLFNGLTGLRQKVANYPGVTVEKKTGRCRMPDASWAQIIDLPGTYSLISRSPDELVAMEVLRGLRPDTPVPDVIVVVVDASNLQRNLYLVSQILELGRPMVVALNMMDVAQRRGIQVCPAVLQEQLGLSVIPIVGHKGRGIPELKEAIATAHSAPMPDWSLPGAMLEELLLVGGGLAIIDSEEHLPDQVGGVGYYSAGKAGEGTARLARYQALAERLLVGDRAGDLDEISRREPVGSLLGAAASRMAQLGIDPMQADIEAHYRWVEQVAKLAMRHREEHAATDAPMRPRRKNLSERVDAIFIHKIWGLLVFAAIMACLFVTIFYLAQPIMEAVAGGIDALGIWTTGSMNDGPLKALLADGLFAGVGAVVVFVPQIALLFMFLAILEDSGYLARAAFLMDRLLSKVGLHGKSFIPLLSSFACAIPGIMATRTIENRKDRLATILIVPFMSCSARLPVYMLLIGTFFVGYSAWTQAGLMLSLYALGIAMAALMAWVFKRTLLKGPTPAFILELPSYKIPQPSQVLRQVWNNSAEFLKRAGTTIFFISVLLWAMTYYPRAAKIPELSPARQAAAQREQSIAGRLGHAMAPVLAPLGYDWKMGVGLVGAFAAREVFVSTMAITYAAQSDDPANSTSLAEAMRADRYPDGRMVWTPLVAVSLLVWFALAMQCMSTLAVVRREAGGWGWPIFMLVYMNTLAYGVCLGIFQIGRLLAPPGAL